MFNTVEFSNLVFQNCLSVKVYKSVKIISPRMEIIKKMKLNFPAN